MSQLAQLGKARKNGVCMYIIESDRSTGVQDMVCRSICVWMLWLALG